MLDAATIVRTSFLQWLLAVDKERRDWYGSYREYYDGDHDTQLTDRQRAYLEVKLDEEFNCNYCPIVVDALAERLSVVGFDSGNDALNKLLWDWWQQNRMDGLAGIIHTATVRDGDGYVITEWDEANNRPRWVHEPAFDGTDGVEVRYSREQRGVPAYAVKYWRAESERPEDAGYLRRMNLYYPDRVEKYASDERSAGGDWQLLSTEPWVDGNGEPLGIPVHHFKHRDQGWDYGQSELKSVVPMQNALNKAVIDLIAAADNSAFAILYMLGDTLNAPTLTPGSVVSSMNATTFGRIAGEDLTPLIRLKDSFAMEVARLTRTPLHYFQISGERPAEGTLKQEEVGLVSKAQKAQVDFGNTWEDALRMGIRLANTFGTGYALDETATLSTLWDNAQTRDEDAEVLRAVGKKNLGIPEEVLWAELGYTQEQIDEMKATDEYQARQELMKMALTQRPGEDGDGDDSGDEGPVNG
jgi:hypothetical protein